MEKGREAESRRKPSPPLGHRAFRIFCVFMTHYGRDRRQDGKPFVWNNPYGIAHFGLDIARRLSGSTGKSLCRLLSRNDQGTISWIHDTSVKGFTFVIVTRRAKLKALRAPDLEIPRSTGLSMPSLTRVIGHNISLNGCVVSCLLHFTDTMLQRP